MFKRQIKLLYSYKRQFVFAKALILVLSISAFTGLAPVSIVSANSNSTSLTLSMPVEYVNYTITPINGSLWAKIDGDYPIYVASQSGSSASVELPMVYPMPPETTNIHVLLDSQELSWTNYTQANPGMLHHTAIGDWWMISTAIGPVSNFFELKIHYEHPLQIVNGSYLFLYDLNISPYLSEQNSSSTCYYTIRMEANTTNLYAYTTKTDTQWNPINYTITQQDSTQVVSIQEHSQYTDLPGDLVVTFSNTGQIAEFPLWVLPTLVIGLFFLVMFYIKKKTLVEKII